MNIRKLILEVLDHFTFFILYYSIFSFLVVIDTNSLMVFLHGTFLMVPFITNFFLRRITKRLGILLLIHAPMPVVVGFVLSQFGNPFWWVVMSITLAIHSVVSTFRELPTEKIIFLLACVTLIGGASVASAFTGLSAAIFPTLLTVAAVGRILLIRMVKIDMSLDTMYNIYNQPINKIVTFDYKFMLGIGAVLAAFAVVLYLIAFAPLFGLLMDNLPDPQFVIDTEDHGRLRHFGGEPTAPTGNTFFPQQRAFWNVIASILFFLTGIVMTIGVVYGVYKIIKLLAQRKTAKFESIPQADEPEDEREFVLPRGERKRRHATEAKLHPIRRLFRDTAKKHIKMGVSIKKSDTPTDIAGRIITEDITTLASEYARIRYRE